MNKLLLICPPNVSYDLLIGKSDKVFYAKMRKEIPMGALSILTYIRQHYTDWRYELVDLCVILDDKESRLEFVENPEKVLTRIFSQYKDEDDDISEVMLGISSIFDATFTYLDIISKVLRKVWKNGFIFTGGTCSSNLPKEVFKQAQFIEAINFGEGELPILKYIKSCDKRVFLSENNSWITREKLEKGFVAQHDFIDNLDEIDTLDYSFINFEAYSSHTHRQSDKTEISVPLMFSRGCPFNCCFCASHSAHGRKVRYNSLERIISDIGKMKTLYNMNTLVVWDDNFFVDMNRAYTLLDYCESLDISIEFANSFPVYRMDEKLISRLKRAGVEVASLAIESGCQRVLNEVMHKGHVKLDMVGETIRLLRQYGFYVLGLFVIGLPGETREELEETVEFIKTAGLNWVSIFPAAPVAGSELYDICKKNGLFEHNDESMHDFYTGNISTSEFCAEDIEKIQQETSLYVNFVNNWDMNHGNYEVALINFKRIMDINPDNPFSYYYASICCEKLGKKDDKDRYLIKTKRCLDDSEKWKNMFMSLVIDYEQ